MGGHLSPSVTWVVITLASQTALGSVSVTLMCLDCGLHIK